MTSKKILIIGSTGFIGSYLLDKLFISGYDVTSFSKSISTNNKVKHIQGDICDKNIYKKILKNKPNVIYLLSGISGQINTEEQTLKSWQVNVYGLISFLDAVVYLSPKSKIIFSGSRLEYGMPKYLPVDENHLVNPIGLYGFQKSIISLYCQYLFRKYNLDTVVLRTSNPYGVWKSNLSGKYNIISYLINLSIKNKQLLIYGSGKQKRDYLYIDDFIDLLVKLIDASKTKGQIYNIGSGKGISLDNVAKQIIKITGKGKIKYISWPKNQKNLETGNYISDISKIYKDTKWKPKIHIVEGLKAAINNFL
jgi:UDP-glucose 4-epimerase